MTSKSNLFILMESDAGSVGVTHASILSRRVQLWVAVSIFTESGIVMVDGTFFDASFEQDRSWDDSGTTISGPGRAGFFFWIFSDFNLSEGCVPIFF